MSQMEADLLAFWRESAEIWAGRAEAITRTGGGGYSSSNVIPGEVDHQMFESWAERKVRLARERAGREQDMAKCPGCGRKFRMPPGRPTKKYCSTECCRAHFDLQRKLAKRAKRVEADRPSRVASVPQPRSGVIRNW